ncbi:MAG: response regulator [Thalassobaculum sp.]|uniref:response regulator transcription factor n=1 Tax=Thalassobaculum sp. TaxID=2022740 RepID=UPI0032EED235
MRIYLIDDDEALRNGLREVLERAGHEVRVAENGLSARRTLRDWPVDLVICDMLMPDAEGFEVLRTVRTGSPGAKFVMISGASGELSGFLDRAPMLGADAVLQKPFAPQELLTLIDAVCGDATVSGSPVKSMG